MNIPIIFAFTIVAFSSDCYRKLEDFALSTRLYKISSINDVRLWGIHKLWEKKLREPVKVSQGLKIRPLTDYDLLSLAVFVYLVIFLAVCWKIWQIYSIDKFTLIFDLAKWIVLDDKIYQPSTSCNRINLSSSSAKNKVCITLIWRK